MIPTGWRASWSILGPRRYPATTILTSTTTSTTNFTMSFSTARIVQEIRNKYRSDELEAKRQQEKQENISQKKKTTAATTTAAGKKKKLAGKARKPKDDAGSSDRGSVVPDSEPERLAEEQKTLEKERKKVVGKGLSKPKNVEYDSLLTATYTYASRDSSVQEVEIGTPEYEITSLLQEKNRPVEVVDADDNSDADMDHGADGDIEFLGANKMNLDQYRYHKPGKASAVAVAARAITSRSGLAEQSKGSKSGMPTPGSMDKFLNGIYQQQPEASTSTSRSKSTEQAEGAGTGTGNGKKTMSRANSKAKAIPKPKAPKKEKVELPEYPVSEVLMKELDGCVVCGKPWPPRQMLKTKWVGSL